MKRHWIKLTTFFVTSMLVIGCGSSPLQEKPSVGTLSTSTLNMNLQPMLGEQMAFVSDRRQRANLDIWLLDFANQQMVSLTADTNQNVKPAWSPDGRFIAFMSLKPNALRSITMSDRSILTLIAFDPPEVIRSFVWSKDGESIYYSSENPQTLEFKIWRLTLRSRERKYLTTGYPPLSVSADNQFLAFSDRNPEPKTRFDETILRVMRLSDGKNLQVIKSSLDLELAWSGKGNYLAVTSGAITIFAVEGEELKRQAEEQLVSGSGVRRTLCSPVWSPSRQEVLAVLATTVSNVCQGEFQFYDIRARLTERGSIAQDALLGYPQWSSDGKFIVYSRNDGLNVDRFRNNVPQLLEGQIWLMQSDGLFPRPLIRDEHYNGQPVLKP